MTNDINEEGDKMVESEERISSVFIWGTMVECRCIDGMLKDFYPDVHVIGYASHRYDNLGIDAKSGRRVVSLRFAEAQVEASQVDAIIVVINTIKYSAFARFNISDMALERTFVVPIDVLVNNTESREAKAKRIFSKYKGNGVSTVQFLLTENCNLNCALCSHFSPLVKQKNIYEFENFKRDVVRVDQLFSCVSEVGLWGGETLLVPDLSEYVYYTRKVFPHSKLTIGTNGLLLRTISMDLISAIRETKAVLYITVYPPMRDKVDDLIFFLQGNNLKYEFSRLTEVDRFGRRYDLSAKNDPYDRFNNCNSRYCTTVQDGKLGVCYFPLIAHRFNEYYGDMFFDTHSDIIDIFDQKLTEESITRIMNTPMSSCKYCAEWSFENWCQVRDDPTIYDWVR